jgi:hypothetical protein
MSTTIKTVTALQQAAQVKTNSLCNEIDDPIIINRYTQRVNKVLNQIISDKWSKNRIRHEAQQNGDIKGVCDTIFMRDICINACNILAMC